MTRRALWAGAAVAALVLAIGATAGWTSLAFMEAELAALLVFVVGGPQVDRRLDRRIRGNQGELEVGAVLDAAAEDGWLVLHDVQTGRGNIDHLLVGPGGILTVETKSHRGRRRVESLDARWLRQAYAQRKLVEQITGMPADALLVFSDAFLDRAVSRQKGVCVLPLRMLRGHLAQRPPVLAAEDVRSIHERLACALAR